MRLQLLFFYWMVLTSIECDDKEKNHFSQKSREWKQQEFASWCKSIPLNIRNKLIQNWSYRKRNLVPF